MQYFLLLLLVFISLPIQLPLAARQPDFSLGHLVSPFFHNNNSVDESIESEIEASGKTFLMSVNLATPSGGWIETLAVADTGSDLIWLDGNDCTGDGCHCEGEKKENTAQCIHTDDYWCNDKWCDSLQKLSGKRENPECSFKESKRSCPYNTSYGDGFNTSGKLAMGDFLFAENTTFPIRFGVSTTSNGTMNENSAGIVGLGRGNLSLAWQLSKNGGFLFRFSYCLIHPKTSTESSHKKSKLRFGPQVTISKNSAKLLGEEENKQCKNRYCVKLEQISVEDHVQNVSEEDSAMMIDTGTTYTFLRENLFNQFIEKVKPVVGEEEPNIAGYCFKRENVEKLKSVSLKFNGGLTVELKRDNIFVKQDEKPDEYCLTVKKQKKELENRKLNVLGSWAQTNFNVAIGVDQDNQWKASFDEEECGGGGDQEEAEALDFQE